ncbi:hypothetical protein PsorP6_003957 [Peronosclerospora sorghi]|uniref:Uncharacterized protein n=1 Tax=Peronosclerospora sorghi TaxID=230839 RepID=A0ACC0VMA4_9STRA|nr:hypothetical protein PsorP6_003957 [Peronosclerospora sorghi]
MEVARQNPSVQTQCPNNMRNIKAYTVPLEKLTERGMDQMEKVGDHIREIYVKETNFFFIDVQWT